MEADRRRETTAVSKDEVLAKAADVVERLAQGRPTDWAQARSEDLVGHYLYPTRRPARGRAWSLRHREEQQAYCSRFLTQVIADVQLAHLSLVQFSRILAQAPTASVAAHLRRCCSAMVAAGLEEGLLLLPADDDTSGHFIDEGDIPTATAVAALASAAREHSGVWWRELQVLVVAYAGLRWGQMAALTADRVDVFRRSIGSDRQVVETRQQLCLGPPKNRRRRTTMWPARALTATELAPMVERRLAEVAPKGPGVPLAPGTVAPALQLPAQHLQSPGRRGMIGGRAPPPPPRDGPGARRGAGRAASTPFATSSPPGPWQPGARMEDVSRLPATPPSGSRRTSTHLP